ncbi:MAG: C40 family peptidase [Saprospiraceae bacterium]|nr:C40 family peptidase [Saprospiraceae bacterium]MDW8484522.1 C40 family peptidase [Saprospiraceae bacterium]
MSDSSSSGSYPSRLPFLVSSLLFLLVTSVVSTSFRPARMLSVEMMQQREEIVRYAQTFIGTPYKYGSRNPQKGFDCSGFTSYILSKFDVPLSAGSRVQALQGKRVPLSEVAPGDLLFFGRKGRIRHVALVVENTPGGIVCIHSTRRGVVLENVHASSYWRPRILFARDVLGEH